MFILIGNKFFSTENLLPCIQKIDWVFFIVVVISIVSLFQVHYNYTGKFNMVNDALFQYHEVKNMQYVYPYFSDEWYAVSLAKESINSHSLPLRNPFDNSFFPNLEMFFHSFIAEIVLLFRLDPITQYTILSIFINTLIIALAYLFLRINNVSKGPASIASLLILYITSASNLPGIWNLIPITMGIILSLIGFCFLSQNSLKMAGLSFLFGTLFYPPFFIFHFICLAVFILGLPKIKDKIWGFGKYIVILLSFCIIFCIVLMLSPMNKVISFIFSHLFYRSFTGNFIPQFSFYYIIPWPAILFAIFGLAYVFKNKKWLLSQLGLGVILWIFYSFSTFRIVIGFERIVFFTSIIVCLISAFGMEKTFTVIPGLTRNPESVKKFWIPVCAGMTLAIFVAVIPFYTQGESWKKLILTNSLIQADSIPMAPANNYLTNDDLRVFKNISQKKFFSIPWKGTVIGITTGNYPVSTKGGTITMGSENPIIYRQFLDFDCGKKSQFAKDRNLDYVYSMPFSCQGFEKVDESSEGFILYKVIWEK
jgi:hypothetical protein